MPCPVRFVVCALLVVQGTGVRDPSNEVGELATIVVDTSDTTIKAGLAGDEKPTITFPFVIGEVLRQPELGMSSSAWGNVLIGNDALDQKLWSNVRIEYPSSLEPHVKTILQYIFSKLEDKVDVSGSQIMMIVSPVATQAFQEKLAQLLFVDFEFQKVLIASAMPLALASVGLKTGLSMLVGGGPDSFAQPIWELTASPELKRLDVSGLDVVKCEDLLLKKIPETDSLITAREIQRATSAFWAGDRRVQRNASIKTDARTCCPEVFFQPSVMRSIDSDAKGIHDTAYESILGADRDIHKAVASNIVVFGSYSVIAGLKERLKKEIDAVLPETAGETTVSQGHAWTGGSQIAESADWISQDMYQEKGPSVVRTHRGW